MAILKAKSVGVRHALPPLDQSQVISQVKKAVESGFIFYFKQNKLELSDFGESHADDFKIQQWINGRLSSGQKTAGGTAIPFNELQQIAYSLAGATENEPDPQVSTLIATWYNAGASGYSAVKSGNNMVYTVTIHINEEVFKNYVISKGLFTQVQPIPPVPEDSGEWWNREALTPWLTEELPAEPTAKQKISYYNIMLLAAHPDNGGPVTSLSELTGKETKFGLMKDAAKKEGHKAIVEYYGKQTEEEWGGLPDNLYSSWEAATIPTSGFHLRIRPQPPHMGKPINFLVVRVRILQQHIDRLHSKHESQDDITDITDGASISRVLYLPAKN